MKGAVSNFPTAAFAGGILLAMAAMFGLLAVRTAYAEPTEVDLPASPPLHRARPAGSFPKTASPSAPGGPSAETDQPGNASPRPPRDQANSVAAADAEPHRPRAYFPYTIRPGDTLEGIAALFGVDISDLMRANRRLSDDNLMAGDTIRIPNPFLARERELNAEIDRLTIDAQESAQKAQTAQNALADARQRAASADASVGEYQHELVTLPWWRATAWGAAVAALLMFGITLAAIVEWLILRARYRAVAEMNDALRRLDQKYRLAMARAELHLQELYGRRRHGIEDGRDRSKLPEEVEMERLDNEIRQTLNGYLARLGPGGWRMRRARWRELMGGVGAPVEARPVRR
jgi:LysM repeat protein